MTEVTETPEDKKRRQAAERQQRKRDREKKLGMKTFPMRLSQGEREQIAKNAKHHGFEDHTEYMYSLVMRDTSQIEQDENNV